MRLFPVLTRCQLRIQIRLSEVHGPHSITQSFLRLSAFRKDPGSIAAVEAGQTICPGAEA